MLLLSYTVWHRPGGGDGGGGDGGGALVVLSVWVRFD
jgi:hypothetical protein